MREYTIPETILANIPYAGMILIGTMIIAYAFDFTILAYTSAIGYLIYGVIGTLLIITFVCPFCAFYATKGCPCGYGMLSAIIVEKSDRNCFPEKFRRHIPVIVPLWLIPVICGGIAVWNSFSWMLVGLVLVFIIESWIILPIVSMKHCCVDCPQKDDCPWMVRGKKKLCEGDSQKVSY
ncbi:hypothetical protein ACFL30_03770 [Candidatus Latescibacterota bacterium]